MEYIWFQYFLYNSGVLNSYFLRQLPQWKYGWVGYYIGVQLGTSLIVHLKYHIQFVKVSIEYEKPDGGRVDGQIV